MEIERQDKVEVEVDRERGRGRGRSRENVRRKKINGVGEEVEVVEAIVQVKNENGHETTSLTGRVERK